MMSSRGGDVEGFRSGLSGELIVPGDAPYDEARKVWNGMIDKRPSMIVRCASSTDVVRAVKFARRTGLLVSVRGGGHNVAGKSLCDGGMVIDLSRMKGLSVDAGTRRARADPGLTWSEFDSKTHSFGLATTGGIVGSTGIAGLTLGGGIGWLACKYGLACDNLVSAEVVSPAGELMRASSTENADLFWGLRGGGGNFGIVTAFEYQLHPVDQVLAGMVAYPLEDARGMMELYRTFSSGVPEGMNTAGALLTSPQGAPIFAIIVCHDGPIDVGLRAVQPLKETGRPVLFDIRPMAYPLAQAMFEPLSAYGLRNYWKSQLMRDIPDGVIDVLVDHFRNVPSPLSAIAFQQLGPAARRVPKGATAFGHRDASYDLIMLSRWADLQDDERNVRWTREVWQAAQPYSFGGVYVNNLGEEDRQTVRSAYGENWERLVALKKKYDPDNFLRLNQNIDPNAPSP